jgi:hypothetical protein
MTKLRKVSGYNGGSRTTLGSQSQSRKIRQLEPLTRDSAALKLEDKVSMSLTRSTLVQLKTINLHELNRLITFVNAHYDALKSLRKTLDLISKTLDESLATDDSGKQKALTQVVDMLHGKLAELAEKHPNGQTFRALLRFPNLTAEKLEVAGANLGDLIPRGALRHTKITNYKSELTRSKRQVDGELKRFYSMRSQIGEVINSQFSKTSEESARELANSIASSMDQNFCNCQRLDKKRAQFFLNEFAA